ncbi:MAG TPA: hypothetical protein VFK13_12135 [Gemmatimonadaceae bacterium]|nr:hypothetical protein [Gemmatimonadaceae bacterium]
MARTLRDAIRRLSGDRPPPEIAPEDVSALFDLRQRASADGTVDDRTWADLDMDAVVRAIDRTASTPGVQCLYDRLRAPPDTAEEDARFDAAVALLRRDNALALRIRRTLAPLRQRGAEALPVLLLGPQPRRSRARWLYPLLPVAMVAAIAAMTVVPRAFFVVLALAIVNHGITLAHKGRMDAILPALRAVPRFTRAAHRLASLDADELAADVGAMRHNIHTLSPVRSGARWLLFDPEASADPLVGLFALLYSLINTVLLLNVIAYTRCVEQIRTRRGELLAVFEGVGMLDVYQAVASLHDSAGPWCIPERTPGRKYLQAEEVRHPLLARAVANSVTLDQSLLITGSNMSGKTTFVRTLGVAAIMARGIRTVAARAWHAPAFRVMSSIGRSDDLREGKSYYLAEVERIGQLLASRSGGVQHLFLLDEIFRGTNTDERVAAGKAVLAELDVGQDLVAVATHDLELLPLLESRYAAAHFREQVVQGELTFDYQLRAGPSSTRNAIELLRVMHYPQSVVDDALQTVARRHG